MPKPNCGARFAGRVDGVAPGEHCVRSAGIGFGGEKAHLGRIRCLRSFLMEGFLDRCRESENPTCDATPERPQSHHPWSGASWSDFHNSPPRRCPVTSRTITRRVRGIPASDGAGVKLTRVIGQPMLDSLDPFLLLDEFGSDSADDYLAGFPDHPHRGFETVTYMLDGRMRHRDNHGNSGLLESGSVQWMTAGRGIVHSEMPEQDHGLMRGFQLWVNLAAKDKMMQPRYQDIAPSKIPTAEPAPGVKMRVVAGEMFGVRGPVDGIAITPVYLDIALQPGAKLSVPLPEGHSAFAYVFEGDAVEVGAE